MKAITLSLMATAIVLASSPCEGLPEGDLTNLANLAEGDLTNLANLSEGDLAKLGDLQAGWDLYTCMPVFRLVNDISVPKDLVKFK